MTDTNDRALSVVIVGAGISGITLGLALQRKDFHNFQIYDRDDGIGGTWFNNAYPGCRCDVEATAYSHSRHFNPNWTQTHPPRDEILAYWQDVAASNGLLPHIHLSHTFLRAAFQPADNTYSIVFLAPSGKEITVEANLLVSAIGGFSLPSFPHVEGIERFRGQVIHASRWPADLTVDKLRGKKVGVVGNACSGTQIVTALARDPEVTVVNIARSHQWFLPSPTRSGPHSTPYTDKQRRRFAHTWYMRLERARRWVLSDAGWLIFPLSFRLLRDRLEPKLAAYMRKRAPSHLKDVIVPDYPLGGKRIVREGGYFAAINKPNVTAVWDHIVAADARTVTTKGGQTIDLDVLVFATGFKPGYGLTIQGRKEITDPEHREKLNCYNGVAIPGFPNFFTILGNNTSPSHTSVTYYIEIQANYITSIITRMQRSGVNVIEVKEQAATDYNKWLKPRLENTVWTKAHSYMRSGPALDGPIYTHFPGFATYFWWINRWPMYDDYVGGEKLAREDRLKTAMIAVGVATLVAAIWFGLRA